ncbi:hypothetical protein GLOIN_2v1871772 [Rhizophagus irregularis DAOM 181602=DAOM 197198]|nr:hypothetical protein GLOIN_2v1871772 [Rhizophagus irregularis DAOM 181602=DAOM 197198]
MKCDASSFKVIQTSKGRRKLVAYFENWETTLRALDTPQFFVPDGKELKWCRHSIPTLKKAQNKPKAKNTPNPKKSGKSDKNLESNQPKKKDKPTSSKKVPKNNNQEEKHPKTQKKAKNSSKKKGEPSVPKDKAQILIDRFGDSANPANFTTQAQVTNIQPTTLSLIFSIALYAASRSWDNFSTQFYCKFGDTGDDDDDEDRESQDTDDYLMDASPFFDQDVDDLIRQGFQRPPDPVPIKLPSMPDIVTPPVDQTVIPENSWKKDKQKARVTDDKQVAHQSTKARPDVKTSAKNSHKGKKSSELEAIQILTGYKAVREEQERIQDIIVYDIPYTWNLQKIIAELKFWGNAIKCSVKRQHKYQTLRVKIALFSFALSQFNKYWTTDLGGIPVRWFPASWTLRERKQREKFQAVIHDISEDMTMATLWMDRKPCEFLMKCSASSFKIIQTSKGRRKLVAYFENWETTLRALDTPQFFVPDSKELKWCRHSIPTLKKAHNKPKAKNTPNSKKSDKNLESKQPKKKDKLTSSKTVPKNNNQEEKHPKTQKKAKNSSKKKGGNKDNKAVSAEILTLLQKLV